MSIPEKRIFESPRGSVAYWVTKPDRGSSEPALVFLHGMTANHLMFDDQVDCFSGRFETVAWDAPLHGSSRPYRDFSYAHAMDDLASLLDAEKIENIVLVGQSMGGFMAQDFIDRYPDRVSGFVAIDSCPYSTRYYSASDLRWLERVGWMMGMYPGRTLLNALVKQTCETERGRETMRAMLAPYTKKELCDLTDTCYRAFVNEHRDIEVPCPVLLILGDKDRTGKVRSLNRRWRETEGHLLAVIEGAGHGSNMDDPTAVNRLVEEFVSSLERDG